MTPTDAFKFGFLARCTEEGLTPSQIESRIQKAAGFFDGIAAAPGAAADSASKVLGNVASMGLGGLGLSVLGGGALGGLGGYALSAANDDNVDPREAKDAELIAEYRRAIQDLQRRRQMSHPQ